GGEHPPRRDDRAGTGERPVAEHRHRPGCGLSAPWPGVRWLVRFRPRPSPIVWIFVVHPPLDLPSAPRRAASPASSPLCEHPRRAGAPAPRWSRQAVPVQLTDSIRVGLHGCLDPGPRAVLLPPGEPLVQRLIGPIPVRYVPPRTPGADPEQNSV